MTTKTIICGIVAVGPDGVIGQNNVMPWHSQQDFFHFKTMTTPYPCVFGKNTFDGLPRRPLPNRLNIVCSSKNKDEYQSGVFYASSINSAIAACQDFDYMFICGGRQIYDYALQHDLIDIMYVTKIYDKKLEQNIKSGQFKYTRFPIDLNEFFDSDKWVVRRMVYPQNVLPVEKTNTVSKFFKCVRVR